MSVWIGHLPNALNVIWFWEEQYTHYVIWKATELKEGSVSEEKKEMCSTTPYTSILTCLSWHFHTNSHFQTVNHTQCLNSRYVPTMQNWYDGAAFLGILSTFYTNAHVIRLTYLHGTLCMKSLDYSSPFCTSWSFYMHNEVIIGSIFKFQFQTNKTVSWIIFSNDTQQQ